jgi:hypothetical protein
MEVQSLTPRLMSDFGYPEKGAQITAKKLTECHPSVRSIFQEWWKTGNLLELTVEGYSLSSLIAEHNLKPIGAFLTLDWLIREPEQAKAALQKGHDKVIRSKYTK